MNAYDIGSSTNQLYSVHLCVGSSATFSCELTSGTTSEIVWRKDGIVITDSTPGYTLIQTQSSSTLVTDLVVHNTTLGDDGAVYTCFAATTAMKFSSTWVLNIVGGMYVCMHNAFKAISNKI